MELKSPAPGHEPQEQFLRGRKRPQRKAARWGKRFLRSRAWGMMLAVLAGALAWSLGVSDYVRGFTLNVHRVLVEGNTQLSDGEILQLLGLSESPNILTLDLEAVRANLLRSAWVREVEIERILPATLTLRIAERRPVAVAVLDELYLLAEDGTLLDQLSPRYETGELVLARGLREDARISPQRLELAGRLAAALGRDERLAALVSEIDVRGGSQSVSLHLRAPPVTVLVSGNSMIARLGETAPLLDGIEENYARLEAVDLRFDGRVYLRLHDATGAESGEMSASLTPASGGAPF